MQVLSGYFVKKTQMMDDTIRYLVSMTKFMRKHYENKPLKLIPTNIITAQNYLPLLENLRITDPTSNYHITYRTFAALSSKSESLTLRDIYLKMLMCTRGVTGEKAIEIQKRWTTPIELYEAYRNCENGRPVDEARKRKCDMISGEMGSLVGRKKIQKALSGKISEVWTTG
jgi:crossover junction endonuclease MUS81